ncbi:MAG TPA: hypothetical protein VGG74_35610 [Kofleriaceae bacterium]
MKNTQPSTATTLGPFTILHGDAGDELPPGDGVVPVLALSPGEATWWVGDTATKTTLVDAGNIKGARWLADGKHLRVGFGTLDLDARTFAVEPSLRSFVKETSRIKGIAWFADGNRVALLIGPPGLRTDRPILHGYDRTNTSS